MGEPVGNDVALNQQANRRLHREENGLPPILSKVSAATNVIWVFGRWAADSS